MSKFCGSTFVHFSPLRLVAHLSAAVSELGNLFTRPSRFMKGSSECSKTTSTQIGDKFYSNGNAPQNSGTGFCNISERHCNSTKLMQPEKIGRNYLGVSDGKELVLKQSVEEPLGENKETKRFNEAEKAKNRKYLSGKENQNNGINSGKGRTVISRAEYQLQVRRDDHAESTETVDLRLNTAGNLQNLWNQGCFPQRHLKLKTIDEDRHTNMYSGDQQSQPISFPPLITEGTLNN